MGIRDKPIAPGSPWQNASAERLIGSILRECVDHMVVVFAENLVRLEYLDIADRKGLALANSQRSPGSYAERPLGQTAGVLRFRSSLEGLTDKGALCSGI